MIVNRPNFFPIKAVVSLAFILLISMLAGCTVSIPNITVCATAGVLSAGGDCAETLSGKTSSLTLDQWIEFLEPQAEQTLPDGKVIPSRGAALCMSSDGFAKLKTAMEQACKLLGAKCQKEVTQRINDINGKVEKLQATVMTKKKKRKETQ
jgi:hypothetical protein